MKRTLLITLLFVAGLAQAQLNQGGFVDGNASQTQVLKIISPYAPIKVSETQILPDETLVTLEGYITGPDTNGDSEDYIFQDASGTIGVEIDNKLWRGQIVTPETKIRILGELDVNNKRNIRDIDVKYLTIIE